MRVVARAIVARMSSLEDIISIDEDELRVGLESLEEAEPSEEREGSRM